MEDWIRRRIFRVNQELDARIQRAFKENRKDLLNYILGLSYEMGRLHMYLMEDC